MSADAPELSVILPVRNEAATVGDCITRTLAACPGRSEVIVVDGGTDGTGEVVRALAGAHRSVRYILNRGDRGKGHAIRVGIEAARAPVMAQLDADLQFLPEDLPRLVAPIVDQRADVVLGSRFLREARRLPGSVPAVRAGGNRVVSAWVSLLFHHRMTDVLAGIKAWSRRAIDEVRPRIDGFGYEIEIPARALLCGLRVLDVPVTTASRHAGRSHVPNVMLEGVRLLGVAAALRLGRL
jgi:glycosyltransferase involved in cell wall biosynthesis